MKKTSLHSKEFNLCHIYTECGGARKNNKHGICQRAWQHGHHRNNFHAYKIESAMA